MQMNYVSMVQSSRYKVKGNSFDRATLNYSSVQLPFDINFPWSLVYIRKIAFGSPYRNYFTLGFVGEYGTQEWHTCTDTALSGYHLTPWSSGA